MKSKTRTITLTANLAAAATALRLIKNGAAGPIQFINLPGSFSILAGSMLGPISGFITGVISILTSDIILGAGIWTIMTSTTCGLIGFISGIIWHRRKPSKIEAVTLSYILFLSYDIITSITLYLPFMSPPKALIVGITGLFLPIMGGSMYAIGPITELSSTIITTILLNKFKGEEEIA